MSTSAVASRSQRQKVSAMLRTLGLPCLLLQNPGPWFWGWKKNSVQCRRVQLGGICGLRCSGSGPRAGLCRERSPRPEGAGVFLWGWFGRAAWVQGALGEVGEAHLSRPAVLSLSCPDDLNSREGEGRLKRQVLHEDRGGAATEPVSSCQGHLVPRASARPFRSPTLGASHSFPCFPLITLARGNLLRERGN